MRSLVKVGEEENRGGGRTQASIAKIDASMRFCFTLQLINANQTPESVVLVFIKLKRCV